MTHDERQFSEAANRLFDILLFEERPGVILDSLTRILGETLAIDRSLIYDISFTNGVADGLTEWLNPARPELTPTRATYPLGLFGGGADHVFATREPLESYAHAPHPVLAAGGAAGLLHETMQIESLLWFPFSFRVDGFYLLAFNVVGRAHQWTAAELEFVRSATRHVGMALLKIGLIREKALAEEALLSAQKLESLGVLAGGIAHDFNNLMVGVIGNAQMVARRLAKDSPLHELVAAIQQAGQRAAGLASQLLAYAGKGLPGVSHLALDAITVATARLAQASIPDVRFDLQAATPLPMIEGNPTQVEQVVMNLLINAAEALGDRRLPVRVRLRSVELDLAAARRFAPVQPTPGSFVALEVTDAGCGMSPETIAKIFDPFFTTKFTGRGLGLSAVLGIVRKHRGALRIDSQVGKGSTFVVLFPVATRPPLAATAIEPFLATGDGRVVLVIDDEPMVATTIGAVLDELGFSSVVAVGGREGLARFLEWASTIACVMVNLTMPPPGGRDVMRRVRELRPTLPIVLMSGYAADDDLAELSQPATTFIHKPFVADELLAALARVMPPPDRQDDRKSKA